MSTKLFVGNLSFKTTENDLQDAFAACGTVVETNIHYPTDSKLLNDGVRVLTREMKRLGELMGRKVRDFRRSVKLRVLEIARASRNRTGKGKARKNKTKYKAR
jgi:RNA recognition motif-containing protein